MARERYDSNLPVRSEEAMFMFKKAIDYPDGFLHKNDMVELKDVLRMYPVNVYSPSFGKYTTPLMLAIRARVPVWENPETFYPVRDKMITAILYHGANPYLTDEHGQNMVELYKKQPIPSKEVVYTMNTISDLLRRYHQLSEEVKKVYLTPKREKQDITKIRKYARVFEVQLFDWMSDIVKMKTVFDRWTIKSEEDFRRLHKLVLDCTMSLLDFIIYKVCNGVFHTSKLQGVAAACLLTAIVSVTGHDLQNKWVVERLVDFSKRAYTAQELLDMHYDILERTDWQGCEGLIHIDRVYPIGKEEEDAGDEKNELPPSYDFLFPEDGDKDKKAYSYGKRSTKSKNLKSVKSVKKAKKSVKKSVRAARKVSRRVVRKVSRRRK